MSLQKTRGDSPVLQSLKIERTIFFPLHNSPEGLHLEGIPVKEIRQATPRNYDMSKGAVERF
jgi:hypothetical protein